MIWTTLKTEAERSYETPVYTIKFKKVRPGSGGILLSFI